jgi:hypothetical protein
MQTIASGLMYSGLALWLIIAVHYSYRWSA